MVYVFDENLNSSRKVSAQKNVSVKVLPTYNEREVVEVENRCRKEYVSVNVDVDEEGTIHPRFIRWKDGLIFRIDKITYKCRATSNKVGGGGIRYTVLIRGKESFLFREGDKWFVEAKEVV